MIQRVWVSLPSSALGGAVPCRGGGLQGAFCESGNNKNPDVNSLILAPKLWEDKFLFFINCLSEVLITAQTAKTVIKNPHSILYCSFYIPTVVPSAAQVEASPHSHLCPWTSGHVLTPTNTTPV